MRCCSGTAIIPQVPPNIGDDFSGIKQSDILHLKHELMNSGLFSIFSHAAKNANTPKQPHQPQLQRFLLHFYDFSASDERTTFVFGFGFETDPKKNPKNELSKRK